jgi:hypothetical protein
MTTATTATAYCHRAMWSHHDMTTATTATTYCHRAMWSHHDMTIATTATTYCHRAMWSHHDMTTATTTNKHRMKHQLELDGLIELTELSKCKVNSNCERYI